MRPARFPPDEALVIPDEALALAWVTVSGCETFCIIAGLDPVRAWLGTSILDDGGGLTLPDPRRWYPPPETKRQII